MPKYLLQATYNQTGVQGVLKEGGTARREALRQAAESLGGSLDAFYFAFGDVDVYCIVDLPSNVVALKGSLLGNAAGTNQVRYTVLATPEEVDEAAESARSSMDAYRAPGK
ncbi:MAG: GYD domain-containing protein [Caldilineaceae bacterium]|nr:GYD domain-containing protein [Caldilineaceae bacterium]